jgi:hypothetical protein
MFHHHEDAGVDIRKTWRFEVMCVLYGHQNINESTEHPVAKSVAPIQKFGTCIRAERSRNGEAIASLSVKIRILSRTDLATGN